MLSRTAGSTTQGQSVELLKIARGSHSKKGFEIAAGRLVTHQGTQALETAVLTCWLRLDLLLPKLHCRGGGVGTTTDTNAVAAGHPSSRIQEKLSHGQDAERCFPVATGRCSG